MTLFGTSFRNEFLAAGMWAVTCADGLYVPLVPVQSEGVVQAYTRIVEPLADAARTRCGFTGLRDGVAIVEAIESEVSPVTAGGFEWDDGVPPGCGARIRQRHGCAEACPAGWGRRRRSAV